MDDYGTPDIVYTHVVRNHLRNKEIFGNTRFFTVYGEMEWKYLSWEEFYNLWYRFPLPANSVVA